MNDLRISVVIPTRHRNISLAACLECLAPGKQTLLPDQYEVIVTDDGRDSTAEEMVAEKFPWARWTAGPRRGPSANRNHGASLAIGKFIAFIDDDCVPSPEWLSAFHGAVTPGIHVYEGKTICRLGVHSPMMQSPINEKGGWLWSCNMMIELEFAKKFQFDEQFPFPHMEDTYLRERLKKAGEVFVFVPEAVVDHPPRPVLPGKRRAAALECEVIYHYKMHEQPPSRGQYLWRIAKTSTKALFRFPLSAATFVAMYHSMVELFYIALHYNQWMRRHANKY